MKIRSTVLSTPRHSVSVAGAVIDSKGRFLAIQRHDNLHWEPPGGVLELGETIENGLVREIREETGFIVTPDRLSGVYKNLTKGIIALVFRCSITGGSPATSSESLALRWFTVEEVANHMAEPFAVRLLDATDEGPVRIRHHDGTTLC